MPRKRRFLRISMLIVAAGFAIGVAGCSFRARYIFTSSADSIATPAQVDLSYEDVWFLSPDGVQLHGWFVPAKTERPLVLFFHGNAANITYRVSNLLYLHKLGLPIFIFDYRGYGASKGRSLDEGDLYLDARGALNFLKTRGWNPDRMIFFGRSLGAAVALQMALEHPPAGVILESPFTSLRDIARERSPVAYYLLGWWGIGSRFDNLGKISQLTRPLLIFYGDQDRIIPPEMSLSLFSQANEPKTLQLIAGAGHSNAFQIGSVVYSRAWINFVEQLSKVNFSTSE